MVGIRVRFRGESSWLDTRDYSLQEQERLYDETLQDVLDNTRWYLDNLQRLKEYRVHWADYGPNSITKPYRFVTSKELKEVKKTKPL